MLTNANVQTALFVIVLLILVKPLGLYMALAADGRAPWLSRIGGAFEKLIYRVAAVDPTVEMNWKRYAVALLLFNLLGALVLYLLQRIQAWLPLTLTNFSRASRSGANRARKRPEPMMPRARDVPRPGA